MERSGRVKVTLPLEREVSKSVSRDYTNIEDQMGHVFEIFVFI